ncbi:hypothetical protein KEM56_005536, partial [Ascosphaera pollenicola]
MVIAKAPKHSVFGKELLVVARKRPLGHRHKTGHVQTQSVPKSPRRVFAVSHPEIEGERLNRGNREGNHAKQKQAGSNMRGIGMDLNGGMRIERLNRYDREDSVFKIEEGGLAPSRPVKMRTFGKEIRERLSAVCEIWDHVLEIADMTKEGFY